MSIQKPVSAKHGTFFSYIIGFILSVILTFAAYILVLIHTTSHHETIPHEILIPVIIAIAIIQMIVQLIFFLHMAQESKPRWNFIFFLSTIGIIFIVVVGSVWIMDHLNHNMLPDNINQYVQSHEGL